VGAGWPRATNAGWLAWRYWTKIFALTFALGVVSGITMSFQFGTNWPGFMEKVGNVAGPLLGYEVLTAFFLEATFLGVMLFGHEPRVRAHAPVATVLVAFGTTRQRVLDPEPELVDADAHRPRRRRAVPCRQLVASAVQPVLPLPLTHMLLASGPDVQLPARRCHALRYLQGTATPAARRSCARPSPWRRC
jgi:cytochrome d ubiquinol oxidase subunit I